MIKSFRDSETQTLFSGRRVARFVNIERVALRKLQQVHAAATLEFLRVPPQNRLEGLKGDRKGQYTAYASTTSGESASGSMAAMPLT